MNINPRVSHFLGRSLLQAQKHSPVILTGVGIVGVVAAGVLAARATLKLEETIDNSKKNLEWTNQQIEQGDVPASARTGAVVKNTLDLVKLYGPSVTLGAVSIVCIVSAQGILHKRNAALVVAYKGLEQAYARYRGRVVEAYGETVDDQFHKGIREVSETVDGKKVKTLVRDDERSEFQFDFGPNNENWDGRHDSNFFFVNLQQNYLNDKLDRVGHVFLNEALERLGLPHTPAGAVTGWLKGSNGDGIVDFGISDMQSTHGYILLDFNVDGTIFDKI